MPPALAGGLLATGPLGKSLNNFLKLHRISCRQGHIASMFCHCEVQRWLPETVHSCQQPLLRCSEDYLWKVKCLSPTLCDPMDCSLPGSSIHGIFQARMLEWVAISLSRRSSQPRDWTQVSYITGRFFTSEPPGKPKHICDIQQTSEDQLPPPFW